MRRDDALLLDMLIAARKIRTFVQGVGEQDFYRSDLIQSAVLRELQVLGQAARLVTDETRTRLPEVAWREILGLRNRIVHEYFNLKPAICLASGSVRNSCPHRATGNGYPTRYRLVVHAVLPGVDQPRFFSRTAVPVVSSPLR
jgi:uncharacterized protein with HEPN domain